MGEELCVWNEHSKQLCVTRTDKHNKYTNVTKQSISRMLGNSANGEISGRKAER